MSKDEIKKQEEVVSAAFSELQRISKALEAETYESPIHEWDALRDMEHKAFMAWRVERSILKTLEDSNE